MDTDVSTTKSTRVLVVLFTGVLIGALDIAIVGPALPAIQADFDLDSRALSWIFNIYILFHLLGAPLLAKLSDRYGRRSVYMANIALFAAGSLVVASATSFGVLLLGRAIQAFGAGGIFPVAAAVIGDTFPAERRGRALGLVGAVFGVAFLLGPLLGGILLRYSWHWLFLINIPIAAGVLWQAWLVLPDAAPVRKRPFDLRGAVTLTIMLAALAFGLSSLDGADLGASLAAITVWPFLLVAIAAAPIFWLLERRAEDPVLDPKLLGSRELKIIAVIAIATGLTEAGMVFLPAMAVAGLQVAEATASFMLLPLVATLIIGAPAAGRLVDAVGSKRVIQAGLAFSISGLALFGLTELTLRSFFAAGALTGLGLAVLLGAPLRYVVLREVPAEQRGAGQGLLTLFLSVGQLTGAALVGGVAASHGEGVDGYQRALLVIAGVMSVVIMFSTALKSVREASSRPQADSP
ncbi:MAG: MFS transporter [Gammaproteobacteria bacterium]|nr:MFS transporter [Gammaproteobacteria bacterium]